MLNNPFGGRLATGFVGVALYLVFEPLLLSNVGATLGKWIMGVRVRTTNGDNVSYLVGLRRTISVATLGLAWGVPVIAQIAMFLGMSRVVKNKPTFWDEWAGTVVEHRKRPFWLWATTIVVVLGLNVGLTMVSRVME
ncbi:MAG: RDD domain containing protein [Alphaproteobacteria bacterium]|nr:MAG: RDD domain containing protein [Caulobacteraceae bacterium]TPW06993.1 MAG: RDD domain containing protein [Alphaproteobacteria bacterium]